VWPWARGVPLNFGAPFDISATAEASNFKFDTQLGFAYAHHKTPRGKVGWTWARGAPQNFGIFYNISAKVGAGDFKFATQLGFA